MHNKNLISLVLGGLLFVPLAVHGQATVNVDSLDSVFVHGQSKAAEVAFTNDTPQYTDLGISGTNFETCQHTAMDGLFCLDGKTVRNWPDPTADDGSAATSHDVVDCEDPALNLDTRKANTCTGFAVGEDMIWLAGKNQGKSHSLILLLPSIPAESEEAEPSCPAAPHAGAASLGVLDWNDGWCGYESASGRPLLVDLAPVDGDVADRFALPGHPAPQNAVLGLEGGKAAVAFLASGDVIEFASGKGAWGLLRSEQLMSLTLMQLIDPDGIAPPQNLVLAVTTFGRVLAWDTAGSGPAQQVYDVVNDRTEGTACNSDDPVYGIRASSTTGYVYVNDSPFCEVIALQATMGGGGLSLEPVADYEDATVSTVGLTTMPTGVTVAQGNLVDLNGCSDPASPCPIALSGAGAPIATFAGVQLYDPSVSGVAIYQVNGIPDCRYVPYACLPIIGETAPADASTSDVVQILIGAGVIVPLAPGTADELNPAAQRLNFTPLLPTDLTSLLAENLPAMLLPRYLRGQKTSGEIPGDDDSGYRFGGFLGITEDGVVFRDTFEGFYDVWALAGSSLGCAETHGTLLWDVVATVSERFASASDTYPVGPIQLVASPTNADCGSVRGRDRGLSFKPYNLEPTPCTFNGNPASNWASDGYCALPDTGQPRIENADDAVYAKMLLVLADEYKRTVDQLACLDSYNENGGTAPLGMSDCMAVQEQVVNMIDKLDKCWYAMRLPKQSSGDQTCQALGSQLLNLQALFDFITPVDPDVANRVGELKARVEIMRHVMDTRFMPSLPEYGFVEPAL